MTRHKLLLLGLVGWSAITLVSHSELFADDPPKEEPAKSESQPVDKKDESPTAESTTPSTEPVVSESAEPGQTQRQPSVDEILKAFQENERPVAEPIMPTGESASELATPDRGEAGGKLRFGDGYFLTDRVGRLMKDGVWYSLAFEADSTGVELGSIKLLPNRMLEMVVHETEGTADSVLFLVSGEVTEFMGENYLLVRKAIRKRDFGNLKK